MLLQDKSLSIPHPVLLASRPTSSSSNVQRRAPALSQNPTAALQLNSPLQPPRLSSLSPHTALLPHSAAFVQPRSSHDEADTDAGTNVEIVGCLVGRGIGAADGDVDGLRVLTADCTVSIVTEELKVDSSSAANEGFASDAPMLAAKSTLFAAVVDERDTTT